MRLGRFAFGSMAVIALAIGAASAHADTLTVDVTVNRIGSGGGGPFHITGYDSGYMPVSSLITDVDGDQFNSFCMELAETVAMGGTYHYTIDTAAYAGGFGGGNPDPLSVASAKLFYAYWTGQLAGFEYTPNTDSALEGLDTTYEHGRDGRDLQNAFWFLEDEIGSGSFVVGGESQDFIDWIATKSWASLGQGDWSDDSIGEVRVLNLVDDAGNLKQSQLVIVPLPAGALMGFALLGALGIAKRIRSRRQNNLV